MSSNSTSKGGGGRRNRGQRRSSPRKSDPEPKKNTPRRLQNKLYIGDLLESVKKEDLEREFSRFGKIREVWLAHHPPGFAFVEFVSTKDAADVIDAFDGKMLCGSKVRVEYAKANGPANAKRAKRKDPPKAAASSSLLLDRISPLLSLPMTHRSLVSSSSTSRSIPPLLSLVRTSSPARRGRNDLRFKEVEPLSLWGRASSPTPLLLPPRYHSRHSPIGRDRSPSPYRDAVPPPLMSTSLTRDLHRVYPLLPPPPPPPLPPLSSRSRNDNRARSPTRDRSRSPVYVRRTSSPAPLPPRGRLLGRTPPPLPHERSPSVENRYSPRRSRGRESPLRLGRSPSLRRSSPMARSPLVEDRRTPPAKYKMQSSSYRRGRSPYSRYSSPETATNYLPRAYASPRKDRSPSSPRQFQGVARPRKAFSRSPRDSRSPPNWNRAPPRSRSPVVRRSLSPRSSSPKRFRRLPSRSPSANGRSTSRRSYMSPVKRYSPVGPRSPAMTSAVKTHARRRSARRSNSLDFRPASPPPKRYAAAGSRSPPIVRSPSPYGVLVSRRSPPRGRSPVAHGRGNSSPSRGRTPPRMYRQDSPRYRSSPVGTRSHLRRSSPFRSPGGSDRSLSPRRVERRSSKGSPPSRANTRPFIRSPSSRSARSYRKGSPPLVRRGSPPSQSPPLTKRVSPLRSRRLTPQRSSSYARRRSPPSPPPPSGPTRNSRMSGSPASVRARSKSTSRSPLRLSHLRGAKIPVSGRRFSMERSPSPRAGSPQHSRYSSVEKSRRMSSPPPPALNNQPLYRSPSVSPRRNSPHFRKRADSRRRTPPVRSPSPLARRGSRRSRSRSSGKKPAFSPKASRNWSPPRSSQHGTSAKSHVTLASWDESQRYKSPKRKGLSSPPSPPPSPPQHHHRHKSKKLKA